MGDETLQDGEWREPRLGTVDRSNGRQHALEQHACADEQGQYLTGEKSARMLWLLGWLSQCVGGRLTPDRPVEDRIGRLATQSADGQVALAGMG